MCKFVCVYLCMCVFVCAYVCVCVCVYIRVETGSGHPGQLGHILSGSRGPDPLYKISRSDPDSMLYHVL